jgi:hypothetical protein
VKNTISDREDELSAVSTEEQRASVVAMADAAEEWLYDEGRGQSIAVYNDKQVCIICIGVVSVVSQYNCVYYCDT